MRLDARDPGFNHGGWQVYHAEECRLLIHVVWVNDCTNQYGQYTNVDWGGIETIQARRIIINLERRFITINPIEDAESNTQDVSADLLQPA